MSSTENVKDIVDSFVSNELSSLDRFGSQPTNFSISPDLVDPLPAVNASDPVTLPNKTEEVTANTAKTGPKLVSSPPVPPNHQTPSASSVKSSAASAKTDLSTLSEEKPGSLAAEGPRSTQLAHPHGPRRLPGSEEADQLRKVSSGSNASVSTTEREKRMSLGDRFLKFGKRITSGSKK